MFIRTIKHFLTKEECDSIIEEYSKLDLKTADRAKDFVSFLKNKEIYVKGPWSGSRDKYITITIGPAELMERFFNATKEFLAK